MKEAALQVHQVFSRLLDPITRHIGFCINSEENFVHLKNDTRELRDVKEDVQHRVNAAMARRQRPSREVEGWLERVDEIEQEVMKIEQRFDKRKKCLGQCSPDCWASYERGMKSAYMIRVIQDTKKKGSFTRVILDESLPDRVVEVPLKDAVGIEPTFEKFKELVEEKEVEIICMHGMAGVGKTTLLKKINNEFVQDNGEFVVVIWVTVPKRSPERPPEVTLREVQELVCRRLGLKVPENTEERARGIFNYLRDKKFMLLLDDLWDKLDLEKVGIPHSSRKYQNKIAFTTRSTEVCAGMHAHRIIKVEPLGEKEAWELFEKSAGTYVDVNSPPIQPYAKTIVAMCGGLPLALVTAGKAMAIKKTVTEWRDVVRALQQSLHELREVETEVFPVLKMSYDHLYNDTMRSCFLFCCLFPEGDSISIERLVEYCIGEGFFDEFPDAENARDRGYSVIAALKAACLLETDDDDDEKRAKLPGIMRHLAFWIASERTGKNKFLVHVGAEVPEVEDGKEIEMIPEFERWQEAERILLMECGKKELTEKPNCPNLLTLILNQNPSLVRLSNNFFELMPALKVLDLSMTEVEDLPEAIGNLLELQYLNLMRTKARSLPIQLKCLVKLKYLNLSFTDLSSSPFGVISSLSKLQILNLYHCSCANLEGSLEALRSSKFLSTLGINIYSVTDLDKIMRSNKLLKCVKYLLINDCQDLFSIWLPSLRGNDRNFHLRVLKIRGCKSLTEIFIDAEKEEEKSSLLSLEEFTLEELPLLKIIWKETIHRGCFRHLRSVHISGCHKLRSITWVVHLENLRALHLSSCNEIQDIILADEGETQEEQLPFSKLKEMELKTLPKLKSIHSHALPFPCLKDLYVLGCPKLKKLPLTAVGIKKNLQGIRGARAWWNDLEWEDNSSKTAFASYFREWN